MVEIQQIQIADIIARLPQLIPWDDKRVVGGQSTCLVVCAGFEDRATAIVKAVGSTSILHLIVIDYPTNESDNAISSVLFNSISAIKSTRILYNKSTFYQEFCVAIEAHATVDGFKVVVDVSAMASYVTSRVFGAIWRKVANADVTVFYAEAEEYHPTRVEWEEFFKGITDPEENLSIASRYEELYFQSRGVGETYECDVFPGSNPGPLATELIAIPSFSLQRVKSMTTFAESRYNVSPRSIKWFLGSPPDKPKNGWRFDALAKLYNVRTGGFAVDTRDYRDILRRLDEMWLDSLMKERHLVVAGMGSKMQNIGVFLFLLMHRECGLLHSEPKEFLAKRYSNGIGPIWCLEFGMATKIAELLSSRHTLKFHW